jgi:hypothetical protein
MIKKLIICGILAIMVFSLTACGHPVDSFTSLEEMQAVMPANFYYFHFNQEGITETGKFEATKKKQNDGSYKYIQYFIWYDIEYMIDGQLVSRNMQVVGVDVRHTITFIAKSSTPFEPRPDLSEIDAGWRGLGYSSKDNRLLLTIDIKDEEGNWYYFVLDGVQNASVAEEAEAFVEICEIAINNRYK